MSSPELSHEILKLLQSGGDPVAIAQEIARIVAKEVQDSTAVITKQAESQAEGEN